MKKALIITYYWPPSGGSGVQRWLKFTKYLRDFGWEPVIYTPELKSYAIRDDSLHADIPDDLTVIRKPIWEPYGLYKKITGSKDSQTVSFLNEAKKPGMLQKLSQWIRGNLFIPDARVYWVKPSIRFLSSYLKENPIDALITTGPPHSLHLIGLGLQKKLGVKWLADFRDPWTNIDFYQELYLTKWADKKHRRLEKEVLTKADRVVSVGYVMAEEFKSIGAKDVAIITNGYDHADFGQVNEEAQEFSFVHLGLFSKARSHQSLWNGFSSLIRKYPEAKEILKIKLIGKTDYFVMEQIKMAGIESVVEKVDYVGHDEVSGIQSSSYVLLLPINRTPNSKGIISGKIFEYMASGRPVLGIGDTDGDAARLLKETKSGVVYDFDDEEGISEYLENKYVDFKENKPQETNTGIEKYSRRELTKILVEELDQIIV